MRQLLVLVSVVLLDCAMPARSPEASDRSPAPDQLESEVARAMRKFGVPGIAVAIVKDGRVVVARGFGVRRLGDPAPVDGKTLFPIASNSKAFTVAMVASLVDEGKVSWDDPVAKHLPGFSMFDPYVTRELTIRDLLSHRSGLAAGAGDLLISPKSTFTIDEIVGKLRYLRPATSFRSRYAYVNVHYITAGKIVSEKTGMKWSDAVRERIFRPLGMNASTADPADFPGRANAASPHQRIGGRLVPVAFVPRENSMGASGVATNAEDMARWLMALLDAGRIPGSDARLFSAQQAAEMWTPQIPIPIADPGPGLAATRPTFFAAGMGFGLRDYKGRKLVRHNGWLAGFMSAFFMVPEERLGIAILTNAESQEAIGALNYQLLDHYLGGRSPDWIELFHETAARPGAASVPPTVKSLPLTAYDGEYVDPSYGRVTITLEGGKHIMRFSRTPALSGEIEAQGGSLIVRWQDRGLDSDAYITFAEGPVTTMKLIATNPERLDFSQLSFTRN